MAVKFKYSSLEDFVTTQPLSVDGLFDDGWEANVVAKGVETVAAILFADIAAFSSRTLGLSSTETMLFANNFFTWISAEALDCQGIVDKYIGDEIMIVFSEDFGSPDPFLEAVETARRIAENDFLGFCPRIGIAKGVVTIGFVGTPVKYNCSVFGNAVTLASRCTSIQSEIPASSRIVFPADLWKGRAFSEVFPPRRRQMSDGSLREEPVLWDIADARKVPMKNLPETEIVEIYTEIVVIPALPPEDRARMALANLKEAGRYWPREIT